MFRRVVNCEPAPDLTADILAEGIRQRFAVMGVEIVHNQMNRLGVGVLHCQVAHESREFKSGPVGRRRSEVAARLGLDGAESVRRAAPLVCT